MAKKILLTVAEAKALWDAAGQINDDYYDWCRDTSNKKTDEAKEQDAQAQLKAFESGMNKLRSCFK